MIFDLDKIRQELDNLPWEKSYEYGDDTVSRWLYIGRVWSWLPSGKYYTAWACSNVSEEEVRKDQEWLEQAENELKKIEKEYTNVFMAEGIGDPTDLYIVETMDYDHFILCVQNGTITKENVDSDLWDEVQKELA